MQSFVLEVEKRNPAVKPKLLRRSGRLPAVYYGRGRESIVLQLDSRKFLKVFAKAGENTIIELELGGQKMPVLVHDIQYDPVSDAVSHVDFIHVDMQKEVTTSVKIVIVGTAPAVKNLAGILDVQKHEVKIKCLPKDLIHAIEVDVSPIVDFHTSIHVKDLKVPSTIKILDNADDTVVTATPPKIEKEEAAPAAPEAGAPVVPGAEGVAGQPSAQAAADQPAQPAKEQAKK